MSKVMYKKRIFVASFLLALVLNMAPFFTYTVQAWTQIGADIDGEAADE